MSYDIELYEKNFLKKALEENMGDWTKADPITSSIIKEIKSYLISNNYQDTQDGFEKTINNCPIQVSIFDNSIAFNIPYCENCEDSISIAIEDAKTLAKKYNLGLYDPQNDEERESLSTEQFRKLVDKLESENEEERNNAINGAAYYAADLPNDAALYIAKKLAHESINVRFAAATCLSEIGELAQPAIKEFVNGLKDSHEWVRSACALALGNIGPGASDAIRALEELTKDPSYGPGGRAREALMKIKKENS